MFDRSFSRVVAAALIALSGTALVTVSFDADARRMGGGASMGRQSSSVMQNRRATTPPPAPWPDRKNCTALLCQARRAA